MKCVILLLALVVSANSFAGANEKDIQGQALSEMTRLVSAKSPTRKYLWCAIAANKLDLHDVSELFFRKANDEARNSQGMAMAFAYMLGFFDSEERKIEKDLDSGKKNEIISDLYSMQCLPFILPK